MQNRVLVVAFVLTLLVVLGALYWTAANSRPINPRGPGPATPMDESTSPDAGSVQPEDGDARIADSTAILRHLETAYPEKPLLPAGRELQAECWLLEDWADGAFMQASRRIAYWQLMQDPEIVPRLWFPEVRGLKRLAMSMVSRSVRQTTNVRNSQNGAGAASPEPTHTLAATTRYSRITYTPPRPAIIH